MTGNNSIRKDIHTMEKFFAKYKENNNEILIFDSETARDAWVNYNDEFSQTMGTTAENAFFKRQAITEKKALALAGNAFDNRDNYYLNEIDNCVVICFPSRIAKEVLESHRYKILCDKFSELQNAINNAQ